METNLIEYYT